MTTLGRSRFPVIALCSSLGGLDALTHVLAPLPGDFPAALIVAQHRSPAGRSALAEVLDDRAALTVRRAVDGDVLEPGHVLVVPEAKHMLVGTDDRVRLIDIEGLPPSRPWIDLLLSTLAVAAGSRAIAVVLTGSGHDGALGAQAIHAYGGQVLVQDAQSAYATGMPSAVAAFDKPAAALAPDAIAEALQQLVATGPAEIS